MDDVNQQIADIKGMGVEADFYNVNAADDVKRTEILDKIHEKFGESDSTIRVMVHSLAFGSLKKFIDDDPNNEVNRKQLEMTLDVMANSFVYWTQGMIKRGLMTKGGKIYSMTSSGGTRQIAYYGVVSAAKACLESFTRQLAMELGGKGIAVNAICAGVTSTPALNKIPGADAIIANALQRNPSKRLTEPNDIAQFIVDNYKSDSGWLTGNTIQLAGGESIVEL
ncbi:unnamed protein product [Rotaria sp. Silwood1]|nr:unnamed protein product [Rotaria sp. Silwood1]CAF4926558.1 unnamed protein product [Rotaria sp. Silwood1]